MARIRSIKPDSAVSLSVQGVSIEARYFFQNLWCHLDDEGRIEWLPKMILANIFPSEDDPYTVADLNRWLAELEGKDGMLRRYVVGNTVYVEAPKFRDHQKINRPTDSKHPSFDDATHDHGGLTEDSLKTHSARVGTGNREQGTGKGNREQGKRIAPALVFAGAECPDVLRDSALKWDAYRAAKKKKPYVAQTWAAMFAKYESRPDDFERDVGYSIEKGWDGIYAPKDDGGGKTPKDHLARIVAEAEALGA